METVHVETFDQDILYIVKRTGIVGHLWLESGPMTRFFFSDTEQEKKLNWNLNETASHTMFFVPAGQSDGSNLI